MQSEGQVALPPKRPLKRSASTISLPTPPRTNRRRKALPSRSTRGSDDSDAGQNTDDDDNDNGHSRGRSNKRRRISTIQEEEDEEGFWVGKSSGGGESSSKTRMISETRSEPELGTTNDDVDTDEELDGGSTSDVPFLSRRRSKYASTGSAPVSPPPSNRRTKPAKVAILKVKSNAPENTLFSVAEESETPSQNVSPATVVSSPPQTPKTPKSQNGVLLRDSPDNPFLSSPESPCASAARSTRSKGSTIFEERPTWTMVYRGVRKEQRNPWYDSEKGRARSPDPKSLLPPEHPDYEPDLRTKPRVLWPSKKRTRGRSPSPSSLEPTTPTKTNDRARTALLRTPPTTKKRPSSGKTANLVDSDDEDGLDPEAILPSRPLRLFNSSSSSSIS